MKNNSPLTSIEIIDWIKNVGRELDACEPTDRRFNGLAKKSGHIGNLANAAFKAESLQLLKVKMGIDNELLLGKYKMLNGAEQQPKSIK